jgi:cytochrome P450
MLYQTIIGTNPWVLHRNQDVFGKDAASFRPERWLGEDRGKLGEGHSFSVETCLLTAARKILLRIWFRGAHVLRQK